MRNYIIRRLLILIPTLLILTFIIFLLATLIPGDIIDATQSRSTADVGVDREALEALYGLDAPFMVQYGRWLGVVPLEEGGLQGFLQWNLGRSWWRRRPVLELVGLSWPVTLELGILAIIIANLISLPVGVYSALRQDQIGDYVARSYAVLAISLPNFWLGTMVIVYPSIWWGYMPPIMMTPFLEAPWDNVRMFLIPAIVLGMTMQGANKIGRAHV